MTLFLPKMKCWECWSSNQMSVFHWMSKQFLPWSRTFTNNFQKIPKRWFTRAEIEQIANLQVPALYKQKYFDILFKHQDTISANKFDLAEQRTFLIRSISRMTTQFIGSNSRSLRPPKFHWSNTWWMVEIWSGKKNKFSLQFSPFLCPKKTRPLVENCPRFKGIKQPLTHWQIQHEWDHKVHWWHWQSKFNHFFNFHFFGRRKWTMTRSIWQR